MADLIVRLYDLPSLAPAIDRIEQEKVEIRRALTPEKSIVVQWVAASFSSAWADECAVSFARQPLACFLALRQGQICGFVAYEATCRNFLGPIGVDDGSRGRGIGEALLLCALHAMRNEGYAYAIIGGAGPTEFFQKAAGAMLITDSEPGIYRGMLRE